MKHQIRHLVVETGHWYSGNEIAILPKHIDRISYDDSTVFVNLTKESILSAPLYHLLPPVAATPVSAPALTMQY